ncbi:MAG: hypothetical protein Q9206_000817 [Seirophora lacunosa]
MFDILEADIVVFQETKIQRKDLVDDMVLVPGWDCYWSLPKHKKGYSGVVIYTRQSVCAPIRAEEGITGTLHPPNSAKSFAEGPEDQQIGGYPTKAQLEASLVDATNLDSEGRCVILEFPAFVLLGVYSPANRDETRYDFRLGFLDVLDLRIRNLTSMGKRIILTGDLNISREELDTANAEAAMRKNGITTEDYMSTPARRMFNQLLEGGKVIAERDQGRAKPVLWDICRGFNPERKGMFTCWEQKVNARPGNYGSRIDYVLSSLDMKTWFTDSNIQEGLMGSDHCPVYATLKDQVHVEGKNVHTLDVINPSGMFLNGHRQREYSTKDMLPMSGKLIPEFDGRRNIKDMFARKSLPKPQSATVGPQRTEIGCGEHTESFERTSRPVLQAHASEAKCSINGVRRESAASATNKKRPLAEPSAQKAPKRSKSSLALLDPHPATSKGQQNLNGFFKAATTTQPCHDAPLPSNGMHYSDMSCSHKSFDPAIDLLSNCSASSEQINAVMSPKAFTPSSTPASDSDLNGTSSGHASFPKSAGLTRETDTVHDPIQTKGTWLKLFTKPAAPRCEGHNEPCKTMLTKKNGMNRGRSFWMCARPLGPSGDKEKKSQWRCHTFIWCSDWNHAVTA